MSEEEYELAIAGLLAMIDAKNARIAELERKYSAACDRNQELEGELARLTKTYYEGDEGETY